VGKMKYGKKPVDSKTIQQRGAGVTKKSSESTVKTPISKIRMGAVHNSNYVDTGLQFLVAVKGSG